MEPENKRIKRTELFLRIAELFAQRGTCERLQVGAVAVKDKRICCTGYNGAPSGEKHCSIDYRRSCKVCIHAEANLIANAAKQGVSLQGTILYLTHEPCRDCAELIIQAGVAEVVFRNEYGDKEGKNLLLRSIVLIKKYNPDAISS